MKLCADAIVIRDRGLNSGLTRADETRPFQSEMNVSVRRHTARALEMHIDRCGLCSR